MDKNNFIDTLCYLYERWLDESEYEDITNTWNILKR